MKAFKELKLVKEPKYGTIGILGGATDVSYSWLKGQKIPFNDDAIFVEMYPISGGAMIIDSNTAVDVGVPSSEQMDKVLGIKGFPFNPAADTVRALYEIKDEEAIKALVNKQISKFTLTNLIDIVTKYKIEEVRAMSAFDFREELDSFGIIKD